jgi:hypothetical protein
MQPNHCLKHIFALPIYFLKICISAHQIETRSIGFDFIHFISTEEINYDVTLNYCQDLKGDPQQRRKQKRKKPERNMAEKLRQKEQVRTIISKSGTKPN